MALLVPEPASIEIDGLRRACGDSAIARVAPHITLVPPVNVRESDVEGAFELVSAAAASEIPLSATLGPAATFHPINPVAYLAVDGPIRPLRERVFTRPLYRTVDLPFVPHVTIATDASPDRLAQIVVALADYRVDVVFESVDLLEQSDDRVWRSIATFALGPPQRSGTGGIVTEVRADDMAGRRFGFVARREGAVCGRIAGWIDGAQMRITELDVTESGAGIGSRLLAEAERLAREHRLESVVVAGEIPVAFLEYRGYGHEGAWLVRRLR